MLVEWTSHQNVHHVKTSKHRKPIFDPHPKLGECCVWNVFELRYDVRPAKPKLGRQNLVWKPKPKLLGGGGWENSVLKNWNRPKTSGTSAWKINLEDNLIEIQLLLDSRSIHIRLNACWRFWKAALTLILINVQNVYNLEMKYSYPDGTSAAFKSHCMWSSINVLPLGVHQKLKVC